MQRSFDKAWNQFTRLPGVNSDPLAQHAISDLLFAAEFEVDLFESGESELTKKEVDKIRKFIERWE